jgi:hypothetical protein
LQRGRLCVGVRLCECACEQPIQSLAELFPFRFVAQRRVMREHQAENHHAHSAAAFFASRGGVFARAQKKAQVAINLAGKNRRRRGARFKINENPFGRRGNAHTRLWAVAAVR